MYYWKIWRETRRTFFAFLIVGGLLAGVALPRLLAALVPEGELLTWARGMEGVLGWTGTWIYVFGLWIGAEGLGEEMKRGTAVFLLTRPRSRGYFLWSFWLVCAVEILAVAAVIMMSSYVALSGMTPHPGLGSFLLMPPILMTMGLLAVGLSLLLSIGTRGSKN